MIIEHDLFRDTNIFRHRMKKNHMDFFNICQQMASRSHHSQFRHGSIAVYRRSAIVGRGYNRHKIHAEVSAVKSIDKYYRYENLVVYVCRINLQGGFMNSRPCPKCIKFMKDSGVSRVYFSDSDGFSKLII